MAGPNTGGGIDRARRPGQGPGLKAVRAPEAARSVALVQGAPADVANPPWPSGQGSQPTAYRSRRRRPLPVTRAQELISLVVAYLQPGRRRGLPALGAAGSRAAGPFTPVRPGAILIR